MDNNTRVIDAPRSDHSIAEAPPTPRVLTVTEMKAARRQYFTVRHPQVAACGHLLDLINGPKNNCGYCWFAYFNQHGKLVQTTDELFQQHGPQAVAQLRGTKYLKQFVRFMATLNAMKELNGATDEVTECSSFS